MGIPESLDGFGYYQMLHWYQFSRKYLLIVTVYDIA